MTESTSGLGFWTIVVTLAAGCGGTTLGGEGDEAGGSGGTTTGGTGLGGSQLGGMRTGGVVSSGGVSTGGRGSGGRGSGGRGSGGTTSIFTVEVDGRCYPVCSDNTDPDGDGWGWENNRDCVIHSSSVYVDGRPCGTAGAGGTGTGGTGGFTTGGVATGGAGGAAGDTGTGGLAGCEATPAIPGAQVVYDLTSAQAATSATLDFFDFPWPELRRSPSELAHIPNPTAATGCSMASSDPMIQLLASSIDPGAYRQYVTSMAAQFLSGNANSAHVVLRFDQPIDTSRLPTPQASLDIATSTVLLVNVDPQPSTRGRVVPIATRVLDQSLYAHPNTLSILPYPGFALEPGRLYAAIVRRSLRDASGEGLGSPAAFEELKAPGDCAPLADYRDAFDLLETQLRLPRSEIAMLTLFRAGEPREPLEGRMAAIDAVSDPAALADLTVTRTDLDALGDYYLVSGTFETLNLQRGAPPYLPQISVALNGSVSVAFDPASAEGSLLTGPLPTAIGGTDRAQPRTETVEFRLAVPAGLAADPSALAQLPVLIYGAGTGGSIDTPFETGLVNPLTHEGVALFSTTPVMHGARAHSENIDPTLRSSLQLADMIGGTNYEATLVNTVESGDLFFNPLNLVAARGNSEQAAVDYAWQAQVLATSTLRATLGGDTVTIGFDPDKIGFWGHSQGAATGPLLATSSRVSAQALSAPSGHLITNLLGKTLPADTLDISRMLGYLTCDSPSETLDAHHPFLNVLQHWFEEVDTVNHAPRLTFEARGAGTHVFVIAGTEDHYVNPAAHDAMTSAARLFQLSPELTPVLGQELLARMLPDAGYGQIYSSLSGNLDGSITGAFKQYHNPNCSDDHFVSTCDGQATTDWYGYILSWRTGIPAVP